MNVDDFKEVTYISWGVLCKLIKDNGYYDKATSEDYSRLKQIVRNYECSKYTIFRIAKDICERTTFNFNSFEFNVAYLMGYIKESAVITFYEYKGKEV